MSHQRFHNQGILWALALGTLATTLTGCSQEPTSAIQTSEVNTSQDTTNQPLQTTPAATQTAILADEMALITATDDSTYEITKSGQYLVSGQAQNFTVTVNISKDEQVSIAFDDAIITNDDFPVLYVKSAKQCNVEINGNNQLSVTSAYRSDGDTNTDAVIFSKDDLRLEGDGTVTITSPYGNGITSKDDLIIKDGTYQINVAKHGLEANDQIHVSGGDFSITAKEGLEATYVLIDDGTLQIEATDDGINATNKSDKSDVLIEVNGGTITIIMGPGDTDGFDSNGSIAINGGTIDITGQSTFDYDKEAVFTNGVIIINGTEVDEIPQPMMGGHGAGGHGEWDPGEAVPGEGGFGKPDHNAGFGRPDRDTGFDGIDQENPRFHCI